MYMVSPIEGGSERLWTGLNRLQLFSAPCMPGPKGKGNLCGIVDGQGTLDVVPVAYFPAPGPKEGCFPRLDLLDERGW